MQDQQRAEEEEGASTMIVIILRYMAFLITFATVCRR